MINKEKNWKTADFLVDSLWFIDKRDNYGKHENNYHGNFVPQIPNQLIRRYTNRGDTVLELYDLAQTDYQRFKADSKRFNKANATVEYLHILEKK